jgi:DNA-binding CsgD family transcriptional regulator
MSASDHTPRERQVLLLLCDGATTDQIAHALAIAPATVDQHLSNLRNRLGIKNRVELAAFATRNGLCSRDEHVRPGAFELMRSEDGTVVDLIFRYVSGDGDRQVPVTNRLALDTPAREWAGEDWRCGLDPLLGAADRAATSGGAARFDDARVVLADCGSEYIWSGWVEALPNRRFMIGVTTTSPDRVRPQP